jgi:RNA polymerase sigma factor (sigma-70 family)
LKEKDFTDKEIIDGCIKGRIRFQEILYRRFYAFAMSICIRYNPNRDDAMEVLNDSFMKVFNNINKFDPEKPFKSWFRKILVNTSLDRYRQNKKFILVMDYDISELATDKEPEYIAGGMEAEEILRLLASVPELYRVIFNLYEIEGYSHDEIAGMLDIAPGTSRSHLSRARAMLRKLYGELKTKPYNEAI